MLLNAQSRINISGVLFQGTKLGKIILSSLR